MYYGTNPLRLGDLPIARDVGDSKIVRLRADDNRIYTSLGEKDRQAISSNGRVGLLLYGPYMSMPAGLYRATIRFLTKAPADAIGKADIAADRPKLCFQIKWSRPRTRWPKVVVTKLMWTSTDPSRRRSGGASILANALSSRNRVNV